MKKEPLVYIDDIRDSIGAIERYTAGLPYFLMSFKDQS
jgi:uncharacterized protein with HEPN domain